MLKITEHFSLDEFRCGSGKHLCKHCGGSVVPSGDLKKLAEKLEELRTALINNFESEVFIYVVSGHRCFLRNADISSCVPHFKSMHTMVAADIKAKAEGFDGYVPPKVIYGFADKIFKVGGVGLYKGHVHVDVRSYKARWGV